MKGQTIDRTEAEERRREQNRLAQRRFRQKHRQRKIAEQRQRNSSLSSESPSVQDEYLEDPMLLESHNVTITSNIASPIDHALINFPGMTDDAFLNNSDFSDIDTLWTPSLQPSSTPSTLQLLESGESETASQILERAPFGDSHSLLTGSMNMCNPGKSFEDLASNVGSFWTSPLHVAVQKGNCRIVRLLLDHDADCNRKDSAGLTPLLHAIIAGHEEVVDILLSHGAGIHHVDGFHRSVLHLAVLHRREGLLRTLLKRCAGDWGLINGHTKEGRSPLCIAVDTGYETAVELLLECGAKVQ